MKQLCLMRHAEAVATSGAGDKERALKPAGIHAAEKMGAYLRDKGYRPDCLLASPATRARKTAEIVQQCLDGDTAIDVVPPLYLADTATILELIKHTPSDIDELMLVGHNPGIAFALLFLADEGGGPAGALERMSPGSIAMINFDVEDWHDIHVGTLTDFRQPKALEPDK